MTTDCLKTTEINPLTVQEARGLKSGSQQHGALSEA